MRTVTTITLASGFAALLLAAVSSDAWLVANRPASTAIRIDSLQSETSESADSTTEHQESDQAQQSLITSVVANHFSGHRVWSQQQYIDASKPLRVRMGKAVVAKLFQQKAYLDAITLLSLLAEAERVAMSLQFSFAVALSRTGQAEQAIYAYQALLNAEPNNQAAAINLGLLLNKTKQYQAAIQHLQRAVSFCEGRKKAKALSLLASAYELSGQLQQAELTYRQSLEYRPEHPATWLNLAQLQATLEMPYRQVVSAFNRAISLKPDYKRALEKLGRYQLSRLNYDDAIDKLSKAVRLAENDEQILSYLAWALWEAGQRFESRKIWNRLAASSKKADKRLLASHILSVINQQHHSLKPLRANCDESRYWLAIAAQLDNDVERSNHYLAVISLSSEWYWRAQLLLAKQPGRSGSALEELVQANIWRAEPHLYLARHWQEQRKPQRAFNQSKQALALLADGQSRNGSLHSRIASVHLTLLRQLGHDEVAGQFYAGLPPELQNRLRRIVQSQDSQASNEHRLSVIVNAKAQAI